MSTNYPHASKFKQQKVPTYAPLLQKKPTINNQKSPIKPVQKDSLKSVAESPDKFTSPNHFYSNAYDDTVREQEHNYFTASFQNMAGTYQT